MKVLRDNMAVMQVTQPHRQLIVDDSYLPPASSPTMTATCELTDNNGHCQLTDNNGHLRTHRQ